MELRTYQAQARDFLLAYPRAFVVAPAGSGKTIIGMSAVMDLADQFPCSIFPLRVLWLANTVDQLDQARAAFASRNRDGLSPAEVSFSCVASQRNPAPFHVVVVDEAHHVPAATWSTLIANVSPDARLWGLSATPFGPDEERNEIVRSTFRMFYEVSREAVEASGHLLKADVAMHDLDKPGEFNASINAWAEKQVAKQLARWPWGDRQEWMKRAQWKYTRECLEQNARRNWSIVSIANAHVKMGESVLILVGSIAHGEMLRDMVGEAFPVALAYSAMGARKRRTTLESFRTGSLPCLIATSLADEGLDVPRASVAILALGGRSPTKLIQRVGRVLRPFPGKSRGVVHDYLDAGASFGYAQAMRRTRLYHDLGYEVTIAP
jgi:superfamily II DNA or RNA helicase